MYCLFSFTVCTSCVLLKRSFSPNFALLEVLASALCWSVVHCALCCPWGDGPQRPAAPQGRAASVQHWGPVCPGHLARPAPCPSPLPAFVPHAHGVCPVSGTFFCQLLSWLPHFLQVFVDWHSHYSQFCKVTASTEFVNTKSGLPHEHRVTSL